MIGTSDTQISTQSTTEMRPSVVFNSTDGNFFFNWQDYRNNNSDIYGAFLPASGTIGAGTGIGLRVAAPNSSKAKWANLKYNYESLGTGQNIQFAIRTADDPSNLPAASYSSSYNTNSAGASTVNEVNGSKTTTIPISLTPSQYAEIKVVLNHDGINSPTLHSVRLEYDTIEMPSANNVSLSRINQKYDGTTAITISDASGVYTNETSVKINGSSLTGLSDSTGLTFEIQKAESPAYSFRTDNLSDVSASVSSGSAVTTLSNLTDSKSYKFRVRVKDAQGRYSGWTNINSGNVAVNIDQTAPSPTGQPSTTKANDNTPYWTWTAPTDNDLASSNTYKIFLDTVPGGTTYSAFSDTASYTRQIPLTDGAWYVSVYAYDKAGNQSAISNSSITIDATAPTLQTQQTSSTTTNTADIDLKLSEASEAIVEVGTSSGSYSKGYSNPTKSAAPSVAITDLQPNTTYYYRIKARDAAANQLTSPEYTFKTNGLFISDVKVTSAASSVKITWDTSQEADSFIEYGLIGLDEEQTGDRKLTKSHEISLANLKPGTKYKLRVVSRDAFNNIATASNTNSAFETQAFEISNIETGTLTNSATINWQTNIEANSIIQYKSKNEGGYKIAGDLTTGKNHKIKLKNLESNTSYAFKISGRDNNDNLAESKGTSYFETKPLDGSMGISPQVARLNEVEFTSTTAKISWRTVKETTSWVDYGITRALDKQAGNNFFTKDHVVELNNLAPGTTYYYTAKGEDEDGNTYASKISSFIAIVKPQITANPKVEVSSDNVTIRWETNTKTDSLVEYGPTQVYKESAGNGVLTKEHSLLITRLTQNTSYHFSVGGTDDFGNKVRSKDFPFKTAKDNTGPRIGNTRVEMLRSSEGEREKISVVVSFLTDEESTSYIQYGEGISMSSYNKKTREEQSDSFSHSVMVENLQPSKTYHLRIIAKDKYGNISKSLDKTILTPQENETVLRKIIRVLEETFSWVNNVKVYVTDLKWDDLKKQYKKYI